MKTSENKQFLSILIKNLPTVSGTISLTHIPIVQTEMAIIHIPQRFGS
jgi:hypothetical protein